MAGIDGDLLRNALVFGTVFVAVTAVLFIVRKVVLNSLHRWAEKTETDLDDAILRCVKHPSILWVLAIGLYLALATSSFPHLYVQYGLKALYLIIVLSVTLAIAHICSGLVHGALTKSAAGVKAPGLSKTIINAAVLSIGLLIILNGLGISIAPLLTALGVGGLAVALALQDTLSNLFAGIYMLVERPLKVGDYIKLDSGDEGYVLDIGWRTTRIRKLANNIVIIPNNRLAQSTITNYFLNEKRMSLLIRVGVSYDSDPDEVERVLLEEATAAAEELDGMHVKPAPFVRFSPGFGDFSLDFTLICQVKEFVDQYYVQHELRKRIFKRFKKEGIEIPFPITTVHLKKSD